MYCMKQRALTTALCRRRRPRTQLHSLFRKVKKHNKKTRLHNSPLHFAAADVRGHKVLAVPQEDPVPDRVDIVRGEVRDSRVARVAGIVGLGVADQLDAEL
jgi:hypothetical protein